MPKKTSKTKIRTTNPSKDRKKEQKQKKRIPAPEAPQKVYRV